MCNRKCCRVPTLVIVGVILTIVLVFITGITLTNSINLSNIVRLREKVASDSAAANQANAVQTRAALVEQQYLSLQQRHLSRSDLNYIAANHPKNLQRSNPSNMAISHNTPPSNRIVIEIGLHNYSTNASSSPVVSSITTGGSSSLVSESLSTSQTLSSTVTSIITMDKIDQLSSSNDTITVAERATMQEVVAPFNGAIIDGNIESISVPAAVILDHNDTLSHLERKGSYPNEILQTTTTTINSNSPLTESYTKVSEFLTEQQNNTPTLIPHWLLNVGKNAINNDSSTLFGPSTINYSSTLNSNTNDNDSYNNSSHFQLSIKDYNPATIDFVKRNHVKEVCFYLFFNTF